ncbi:hypothetical protein MBLNU457_6282t1 [Dothideomycetes sp. NU457]
MPGYSPWASLRKDETLRAEILQDVDRCMPENTYFRQSDTQSMMVDILFVFCKLNPDISYRQGMHELLAPILWVVQLDAVKNGSSDEDFLLCQICDSRFIEHDTFTLFSVVMQNAKSFYEQAANRPKLDPTPGLENPIITRVHRIYNEYLTHLDPELSAHLHSMDLLPQIFLMRWIRLLFGREYDLDHVLSIWDVIFAEDPSLEIVDMICLTMILRLRWDLLEADYNTALTLLIKYTLPDNGPTPQNLATDAAALKASFTRATACNLIYKYTNRQVASSPSLPDPDSFALETPLPASLPFRRVTPSLPKNFESMFQDAAKGFMTRGEKWGINKAVRDRFEDIRRGVQDIQNMQTPSAPRRHSRTQSRSGLPGGVKRADTRLAALQKRNESLAKMLKAATDQLWDFQKEAAEAGAADTTDDEKNSEDIEGRKGWDADKVKELGMAIARVQFVQVYLEDPTIPLAEEEEEAVDDRQQQAEVSTEAPQSDADTKPLPSPSVAAPLTSAATEQRSEPPPSSAAHTIPVSISPSTDAPTPEANTRPQPHQNPSSSTRAPSPEKPARPTLAQSSFSWMLGQETSPTTASRSPAGSGSTISDFTTAGLSAAEAVKARGRGFLFGDGDDDDAGGDGNGGTVKKSEAKKRGKERRPVKRSSGINREDDGFDMNTLK